jgi:hypothetical protein
MVLIDQTISANPAGDEARNVAIQFVANPIEITMGSAVATSSGTTTFQRWPDADRIILPPENSYLIPNGLNRDASGSTTQRMGRPHLIAAKVYALPMLPAVQPAPNARPVIVALYASASIAAEIAARHAQLRP